MSSARSAAAAAALVAAVTALGAAVHGQARVERVPRAIERFRGPGGEIGVSIRDVDADGAKPGTVGASGVVIEDVTAGGPAEKAGIKRADVLVEFDGERVRSVRQFIRVVHETPPGRQAPASLLRDGQRINVTVEPRAASGIRLLGDFDGERMLREFGEDFAHIFSVPPAPPAPPSAPAPPEFPAAPVLPDFQQFLGRSESGVGITVAPLPAQLAEYFGARRGVLVTAVQENSAASSAGFKAGDVVTALNGSEVSEPADLRRRTQRLQTGDEFTVEVVRDKKPLTLKGRIERRPTRGVTRVAV